MRCNENKPPPPPPPPPPAGQSVTIGGKTFPVRPLATFEQRRQAFVEYRRFTKDTGLLIAHARDRFLHLYLPPGASEKFRVDFLDSNGVILDTQSLMAGETNYENQGITSNFEARYALVTHPGLFEAKGGESARFSEGLKSLKPEEMPVLKVGGVEVFVDLAFNYDLRSRGLMHRPRMSAFDGMLFAYPEPDFRNFWMGYCYIPISLAYIRPDWTVSQLHDMEIYEIPHKPPENHKSWPSRERVQYVLEVNLGFFEKHKIQETMRVEPPRELEIYRER
jgi:uncharacterized membrane protein (UPF0127 family)